MRTHGNGRGKSMVKSRRRLAVLGACIASLLLAAVFFGSTGSASAGKAKASRNQAMRPSAAPPARPPLLSPAGPKQNRARRHAEAARTAPEDAHFSGAIDGSDPTQTD